MLPAHPQPELRQLANRDDLTRWLHSSRLAGDIAEVGVYKGEFTKMLAEDWPASSGVIHAIDPWKNFEDSEWRDGCANGGREGGVVNMEEVMYNAIHRLRRYPNVQILRATSQDAAACFADRSLIAVFLDANHAHEHAFSDLTAWWPKIAPGGILGIHDCYTRLDAVQRADTAQAVLDFMFKIDRRPHLTNDTSAWWKRDQRDGFGSATK